MPNVGKGDIEIGCRDHRTFGCGPGPGKRGGDHPVRNLFDLGSRCAVKTFRDTRKVRLVDDAEPEAMSQQPEPKRRVGRRDLDNLVESAGAVPDRLLDDIEPVRSGYGQHPMVARDSV